MAYANGTKSRRGAARQVSPSVARYIALVTSFALGGGVIKRQPRREEGFDERAAHKTTASRGYSPIDPKKRVSALANERAPRSSRRAATRPAKGSEATKTNAATMAPSIPDRPDFRRYTRVCDILIVMQKRSFRADAQGAHSSIGAGMLHLRSSALDKVACVA